MNAKAQENLGPSHCLLIMRCYVIPYNTVSPPVKLTVLPGRLVAGEPAADAQNRRWRACPIQ
jgi:hypothetical protein